MLSINLGNAEISAVREKLCLFNVGEFKMERIMTGVIELDALLKNMHPYLSDKEYVFCTVSSFDIDEIISLNPIATFQEEEGLTVVLEKESALKADLQFSEVFKKITLQVHSSLGLSA